jgi:hypothetical protein
VRLLFLSFARMYRFLQTILPLQSVEFKLQFGRAAGSLRGRSRRLGRPAEFRLIVTLISVQQQSAIIFGAYE